MLQPQTVASPRFGAEDESNPAIEMAELVRDTTLGISDDSIKKLTLWASMKRWHKFLWYSIGLSSVILLYGFDFVIVGTVTAMPAFQQDFGSRYPSGSEVRKSYFIPTVWLSVWSAATPIGMMLGSIIAGFMQDRYGRRISLFLGNILASAAVAVCYLSYLPETPDSRRVSFLCGKLMLGFSIGILHCVVQTYLSETAPLTLRGPLMAFFPMFTLLGQLIGALTVHGCLKYKSAASYRICIASQWVVSLFSLVLTGISPESPVWLVRKSRIEKAVKSQERLSPNDLDATAVVEQIRVSELDTQLVRNVQIPSYSECFQGTNRRRTFIIAFANSVPHLFGLALLSNSSYFLELLGMSAANAIKMLILGIALGLLSNAASMWILSSIGRRVLAITTLGLAALLWISMGIAGCFSGPAVAWYSAVSMMLIVCGAGAWPASYAFAAETSSLRLRAKSQAIGWFVGSVATAVFALILPYIYNVDQGNLKAKTGFFVAGMTLFASFVTYASLPEMKGRSPRQIDRMFDLKLPTRAFKHWQCDIADA